MIGIMVGLGIFSRNSFENFSLTLFKRFRCFHAPSKDNKPSNDKPWHYYGVNYPKVPGEPGSCRLRDRWFFQACRRRRLRRALLPFAWTPPSAFQALDCSVWFSPTRLWLIDCSLSFSPTRQWLKLSSLQSLSPPLVCSLALFGPRDVVNIYIYLTQLFFDRFSANRIFDFAETLSFLLEFRVFHPWVFSLNYGQFK